MQCCQVVASRKQGESTSPPALEMQLYVVQLVVKLEEPSAGMAARM